MLNKLLVLIALFLILIAEKCPNDQRCMLCIDGECVFCYHGYLKNGECFQPKTHIKNCLTYLNDISCANCEFGYYLDMKSFDCKKIKIKDCATVKLNDSDKCFLCGNRHQLINNKCDGPRCEQENCLICNEGLCIKCVEGYSLTQELKCIKESIPNCSVIG